jgi:apurinic endonuclease APN1
MVLGITLNDTNYNNLNDIINIIKNLNVNNIQIYLGDKRLTTLRKKIKPTINEIHKIKNYIQKHNINLFVHSILTLNYCKDPNSLRNKWGIDNLIYDMNLCNKINGKGCIIHTGSFINENECFKNFIKSIIIVLKKTKKIPIILETPVDKPTRIGGNLEEYAKIYNNIPKKYIDRVKCCIDTQHLFASGYNFRNINEIKNYFEKFDKYIGLKNLVLIHLNDSDKIYNSHINRHASIGKGYIFKNNKIALKYLINIALKNNIPMVLETEYKYYKRNIKYATNLMKGGAINLKNKILNIFEDLLFFHQTFGNKNNSSTKYRIESYEKAIKIIKNLKEPIYHSNNVKNILGKGMIEKIDEINKTGTLKLYENIKKQISKYKIIKNLTSIWGIGPKIAKKIAVKGIKSINNLKKASINKKIILTNQQKLGLKYYNNLKENIPNNEIKNTIKYINLLLKKNKLNVKLYSAGSHRMKKEKSGDIDIILTYKNIDNIKNKFYNILFKNKIIKSTLLSGITKSIYIIKTIYNKKFRKMDIAFIEEKLLPWYILYFGSSKDFSKKIRIIASKKGYKLTEKGLFNKKSGKKINFVPKNEKDIFNFLKINYVNPENR